MKIIDNKVAVAQAAAEASAASAETATLASEVAIEAAATASANAAQGAAEQLAIETEELRNEITSARDDAQDAAESAEQHKIAVESVVATNDGIMTSIVEDLNSEFRNVLAAMVGGVFATVIHNTNANHGRPTAATVYWIGSATPTNAEPWDLWYPEDAS